MTKTSKSERKYGKDVNKEPPKRRGSKKDIEKDEFMYKILIDGSAFSKAMSHEDCIKVIGQMESKATKLRRPLPSLVLVQQ